MVRESDLDGRTLVQRTSAGTQGVVGAADATRLWAASLVVASATARAVEMAGLGEPAYVTAIDVATNTVTVGPRSALGARALAADA